MNTPKNMQAVLDTFGWNKTELGVEAGVKRQAVNGWFNEGKLPSDKVCLRLKKRHGLNPDFLKGQDQPMLIGLDEEILEVLEGLNRDQPESMPVILKMLKGFSSQ
jgi:DNA-binding XRE family transcriptional regulator